jgi:hypothetical protein
MTSEIDKLKHFHIEICPNCAFNNYLCYGLLCNYRSAYNVSKRRK